MTSSPSSSEPGTGTGSASFALLHEGVQRFIWGQGWDQLREIQEQSIPLILGGEKDVLISAGTASGKTEAAFLPICSQLVTEPGQGIRALYIGPTKALINDQFHRVEALCEKLSIPVHRRHGDASERERRAVLKNPSGILLMTPESLEAMHVLGQPLGRVLAPLSWVVIDEVHAFMGSVRGAQLQSLLTRVEHRLRRRVPRVGLSATLGDPTLAAEFLRPRAGQKVAILDAGAGSAEIKAQVRGYLERVPRPDAEHEQADSAPVAIAGHLFKVLRGANNLVFANSRKSVEWYADALRTSCESVRVPNEFYPHHGNLSRELREAAEAAIKRGSPPSTLVATTTLEMGVDIGLVKSIAQVGVPPSVASLKQRLGRSGRRGDPAVLRAYITEASLESDSSWPDRLRLRLVTMTAMLELLLEGWCEPPAASALHLSSLVQQVLSVIAQHGGARAEELFTILVDQGPFHGLDAADFGRFLRHLGHCEFLEQSSDGVLLLGRRGEPVVNHYSFYAAFQSAEEYRLECAGAALGSLPIDSPLAAGSFLIFAGRRWEVDEVRVAEKVILVHPAPAGTVPPFDSNACGMVHDRVRERVRELLAGEREPVFLDRAARDLLMQGRHAFDEAQLHERQLIQAGDTAVLFLWKGDRVVQTLCLALQARGLKPEAYGPVISVHHSSSGEVLRALEAIGGDLLLSENQLVRMVRNLVMEKYDPVVEPLLLARDYSSRFIDVKGMQKATRELVSVCR